MSISPRKLLAIATALAVSPVLSQAQVLEEVMVTAQKRSQNVQDVGIAISAFTGDQMEKLGYDNAQQVTAMAPGVSTVQPNGEANYAIAMRGVAASDFTTNVESPVALYLDEVYISQMSGAGFQLFDMDRVELLRGPQGTLFGRNATGGLAHFLSNRPTQEFDGYVKGTIGKYSQHKIEGAVGGGLGDTVAVRFSGSYHENDGYIENRFTGGKLNNADDGSYRAQLLWTPTEDIELLLNARGAKQDIDTGFFENASSVNPGELTPGVPNPILGGYVDTDGNPYKGDFDRTGFNELDTDGYTATLKWDFGGMQLTSISDISHVERHYIEDSDASPVPFFSLFLNTNARQVSQELRLDGDTDTLKWVVGGYYMGLNINDNNGAITEPFIGGIYPAFFPEVVRTPGAEAGLVNPYESNLDSYSVFGQLEFALSDQWTAIVGARAIRDEKEFRYATRAVEFIDPNARAYDAIGNLANRRTLGAYEGERQDDEWSGRAQLNWTPGDDTLVYFSWNRGIRGGGYNAPIFPLTPPLGYDDDTMTYDPEKLTAWEIGVKQSLLDGRMRVNASTYYYDYKAYQAFFIIGIDTITFNTDAESTGGELEIIATPIEGLDILLGASYNDIDVELPGGATVASVQSPKWAFNAMVRYEWMTDVGSFALQADALRRSKHYFALTNIETVEENGYTLANVSATYTSPDERWQASAFIDNVTDEEYIVQTFDLSGAVLGMTEQYYGRPRWWGVSLRYSFGG